MYGWFKLTLFIVILKIQNKYSQIKRNEFLQPLVKPDPQDLKKYSYKILFIFLFIYLLFLVFLFGGGKPTLVKKGGETFIFKPVVSMVIKQDRTRCAKSQQMCCEEDWEHPWKNQILFLSLRLKIWGEEVSWLSGHLEKFWVLFLPHLNIYLHTVSMAWS